MGIPKELSCQPRVFRTGRTSTLQHCFNIPEGREPWKADGYQILMFEVCRYVRQASTILIQAKVCPLTSRRPYLIARVPSLSLLQVGREHILSPLHIGCFVEFVSLELRARRESQGGRGMELQCHIFHFVCIQCYQVNPVQPLFLRMYNYALKVFSRFPYSFLSTVYATSALTMLHPCYLLSAHSHCPSYNFRLHFGISWKMILRNALFHFGFS